MNEITPWHWAGFILCILLLLGLDLRAFKPADRCAGWFRPLLVSGCCLLATTAFALTLGNWNGQAAAVQFVTGYLLELSLSLDNLLVIALIFSAFHVPAAAQSVALTWGVLGVLVLRGLLIGVGVALVHEFTWVLYLFGALLVYTGGKLVFSRSPVMDPVNSPLVRLVKKFVPVTAEFAGTRFTTVVNGRMALTPLALVVLLIESSDLVFALDSVPAVFSVTRNAFIVFTSNIFAILGLRSLYFLLAGALGYFRYLKFGLALVLVFVGIKMLLEPHGPSPLWFQLTIPNHLCLMFIAGVFALAMMISVAVARHEKKEAR